MDIDTALESSHNQQNLIDEQQVWFAAQDLLKTEVLTAFKRDLNWLVLYSTCKDRLVNSELTLTSAELLDRIYAYIDHAEHTIPHNPSDGEANRRRIRAKSSVRILRRMTEGMTVKVRTVMLV